MKPHPPLRQISTIPDAEAGGIIAQSSSLRLDDDASVLVIECSVVAGDAVVLKQVAGRISTRTVDKTTAHRLELDDTFKDNITDVLRDIRISIGEAILARRAEAAAIEGQDKLSPLMEMRIHIRCEDDMPTDWRRASETIARIKSETIPFTIRPDDNRDRISTRLDVLQLKIRQSVRHQTGVHV